jgi:hypothetical protein
MLSTYLQIIWVTLYFVINLLYALRFNRSLFLSLDFVPYDNHSFTKDMDWNNTTYYSYVLFQHVLTHCIKLTCYNVHLGA